VGFGPKWSELERRLVEAALFIEREGEARASNLRWLEQRWVFLARQPPCPGLVERHSERTIFEHASGFAALRLGLCDERSPLRGIEEPLSLLQLAETDHEETDFGGVVHLQPLRSVLDARAKGPVKPSDVVGGRRDEEDLVVREARQRDERVPRAAGEARRGDCDEQSGASGHGLD
jgi:hypothetical protein